MNIRRAVLGLMVLMGIIIVIAMLQGNAGEQKKTRPSVPKTLTTEISDHLQVQLGLTEKQTKRVRDIIAHIEEEVRSADDQVEEILTIDQRRKYGQVRREIGQTFYDEIRTPDPVGEKGGTSD